jgi:hypothetical protein
MKAKSSDMKVFYLRLSAGLTRQSKLRAVKESRNLQDLVAAAITEYPSRPSNVLEAQR